MLLCDQHYRINGADIASTDLLEVSGLSLFTADALQDSDKTPNKMLLPYRQFHAYILPLLVTLCFSTDILIRHASLKWQFNRRFWIGFCKFIIANPIKRTFLFTWFIWELLYIHSNQHFFSLNLVFGWNHLTIRRYNKCIFPLYFGIHYDPFFP